MRLERTERFKEAYRALSVEDRERVRKALGLLASNWRHPGLRVKKLRGTQDIWEARVSRGLRLTFNLRDDTILLRNVGLRPGLGQPMTSNTNSASASEPATNFYDALAPLFDVMTDWDARLASEGPFLQSVLREVGATGVLDAACGSGGHTMALTRWGYRAAGADVSPGMIALAKAKATTAGVPVPFLLSDLAGLPAAFAAHRHELAGVPPFDAVLCLGNSLPHLLSHHELVAGLRGMAAVLRPGGLIVLQNLNYDLRWRTQPRFFAAQSGKLDEQEVLVWRFADYDVPAERIAFHIALFRRGQGRDWRVEVHTTPQRPLFQAGLRAALAETGFDNIRAYGRLALPAESFDPQGSPDLVVTARLASPSGL